jgi:hypothetical protein
MAKHFPLADVLANIAEELIKAQKNADKRGLAVMQFEECEVEFAVEFGVEGSGGINVWVLDLSGGGNRTESNTVRIKFKSIGVLQAPQIHNPEEAGPILKKQT